MKKIKPGLVVLLIVLGLFVGIFLGVLIMKSSSSSKYKVRVGHLSIPDSLNQNIEVFLDFIREAITPIRVQHPKFTMETSINSVKESSLNLTL